VVGGFVAAAVAALALAILSLSQDRGLFTPQYRLVAQFANVQGLLPNAPVWLAGKHVGTVESVRFGAMGAERPIVVVMKVDRAVQERIRENSVASIGTIGLLGDRYVEISMGSPPARSLEHGAEITAVSPVNLNEVFDTGAGALNSVSELAANLNDVVKNFSAGGGGMKAAEAIDGLGDIVRQVKQGDGLLHALVYDDYSGEGVDSVMGSLAALEDILRAVRDGDGFLHTLIYEGPSTQTREEIAKTLEAGARLNSVLAKIDDGEGTLGLLVNDPTLYEDLKLLVGGAQRSVVVRSLVRMSADGE
jgi:phospholipid/cholesterol/gamma-HCH transport system substrate-binding protein